MSLMKEILDTKVRRDAELTKRLQPMVVVPTRHDMFAANRSDPEAFAAAIRMRRCSLRTPILEPGKINTLSGASL